MNLHGYVVAVGVTGGIAAYKTCELVSSLTKLGAEVNVVMTKNATQFVAPLTFETLSKNRVICDMFEKRSWEVEHIALAKKANLFVVAPCTANFAAKLACGIADDFLSTTIMAAKCPILLAPAMNTAMLESDAYVANCKTLQARGVKFVSSNSGILACGDVGNGRMAEPSEILAQICNILMPNQDLAGKTIMVTAGATQEAIDPVRYITNHSSGKMGIEIGRAAVKRGAKVILVCGSIVEPINFDCAVIKVTTTCQMQDAVMSSLDKCDVIIKAAAPSDYRIETFSNQKIKSEKLVLTLTKNPDIAKKVGENKGDKKLVIFCAETENLEKNAYLKLESKHADMVVANDVTKAGAGFNVDTNIATIITKNKKIETGLIKKSELANIILDNILEL